MRSRYVHSLAALLLTTGIHAQQSDPGEGFTCLANHPEELARHLANTPGAWEAAQQAEAELDAHTASFVDQRGGGSTYVIPVVFHIIHMNGSENISDAQIYDAVRILNEDFNRLSPDWQNVRPEFLPIVANVGIEFRLAKRDPQGNCTNGITRTLNPLTYSGDFDMTQLIQWPRNRYMNVWVGASANGAAGYTYYPMWLNSWPEADGIVVQHTYLGSIGTGHPSRSRVLTHEVGHWINLPHCWGNSNEPGLESNCNMDDGVADTPLTKGWTSCWLGANSCGSPLDNVENFMEYAYCSRMFTEGQGTRMLASLTSNIAQRNQLWQPSTLQQTGVEEEPILCAAQFGWSRSELCDGMSVQFTDQSYHGVTQRLWTFPGGTPDTSTDANPLVTYTTPGTYPVTLEVSDGTSILTNSTSELITVWNDPGEGFPWSEGFEALTTIPGPSWLLSNPDGDNTFAITNAASFSGGRSLRLENNNSMVGRVDELRSGTFDMSAASNVVVTFRYAYAQRNSNNDDRLRMYVSNNCGTTWSLRKQLRGTTDLNTAGIVSGSFVPSGPEQWAITSVNNISALYHTSNFRIKFEFESAGGNNVYIDDININGLPVSVDELLGGNSALAVVPNPATDVAQAIFQLEQAHNVRLELLDVLGRSVAVFHDGQRAAGIHRVDIPVEGLRSGVYLVRMQYGANTQVQRFVVE